MARSHLDGLADCVTAKILKEGCENCKGRSSGVKRLKKMRNVYR